MNSKGEPRPTTFQHACSLAEALIAYLEKPFTDCEIRAWSAVVEASYTATPSNPDRLTENVLARGRLDSAELLLEKPGDEEWYAKGRSDN